MPKSLSSPVQTQTPPQAGALTGAVSAQDGGGKFTAEGAALPFAGNTFLCPLDPSSAAHWALSALQQKAKAAPWAELFTFLPPSSFHMTVFEGVCMQPAARRAWPIGVAEDASLKEISEGFLRRLERVELPEQFLVRPTGLRHVGGMGLQVTGADPEAEQQLRNCRELLRHHLDLVPPNFDGYHFHITLAYLLRWPTPDQASRIASDAEALFREFLAEVSVIELGPIEFCDFASMLEFVPQRRMTPRDRPAKL